MKMHEEHPARPVHVLFLFVSVMLCCIQCLHAGEQPQCYGENVPTVITYRCRPSHDDEVDPCEPGRHLVLPESTCSPGDVEAASQTCKSCEEDTYMPLYNSCDHCIDKTKCGPHEEELSPGGVEDDRICKLRPTGADVVTSSPCPPCQCTCPQCPECPTLNPDTSLTMPQSAHSTTHSEVESTTERDVPGPGAWKAGSDVLWPVIAVIAVIAVLEFLFIIVLCVIFHRDIAKLFHRFRAFLCGNPPAAVPPVHYNSNGQNNSQGMDQQGLHGGGDDQNNRHGTVGDEHRGISQDKGDPKQSVFVEIESPPLTKGPSYTTDDGKGVQAQTPPKSKNDTCGDSSAGTSIQNGQQITLPKPNAACNTGTPQSVGSPRLIQDAGVDGSQNVSVGNEESTPLLRVSSTDQDLKGIKGAKANTASKIKKDDIPCAQPLSEDACDSISNGSSSLSSAISPGQSPNEKTEDQCGTVPNCIEKHIDFVAENINIHTRRKFCSELGMADGVFEEKEHDAKNKSDSIREQIRYILMKGFYSKSEDVSISKLFKALRESENMHVIRKFKDKFKFIDNGTVLQD